MLKKIIILFSLLFLAGCSTSSQLAINTTPTDLNSREVIIEYLLSQKDFAWQTEEGSKDFCAFYPFNKTNEMEVYIWTRCSEFSFEEGVLKELSGSSGPAKLTYLGDDKFSHQIPRDGALYSDDFERIFPKEIRKEMINNKDLVLVNLNSDLLEEAKRYFEVEDFLETPDSFIQHCEKDSDCITPFNYLVRSSCPYESECINSMCEVVCNLN